MYTLNRGVVKLTTQMPPLGTEDNKTVQLHLKEEERWQKIDEQQIDAEARTATFRIDDWDASSDTPYRLVYTEKAKSGETQDFYYEGAIRRDPVDRPLVLGGLTCQYGTGFPYTPLVKNVTTYDPDMLYFSGDQIYEGNGGYSIIRFPARKAILNYLGKWFMFGWAFGDLMKDRPTVCTPDDHDVYQGNLWGEGGKKIPFADWQRYSGTDGGYVQPAEMVNVVHRTQCSHLPDSFDPTPIEQGILPFYTDLVYGRVSFAIISDRMFKSGPNEVAFWEGRADHLTFKLPDVSVLDRPDLEFTGKRQLHFLEQWVEDWRGADMKVLLSQTVFANIATHHGANQMVLFGDLDSGGWPKTARDRALQTIRKGFAFHIVGDQHLPSLSQYGIDDYGDGGWCFCTPAIFVGYERRFLPDELGWNIIDSPDHENPNTGFYEDPFGNPHYVYAVGNPVDEPVQKPRYQHGQEKSSGYGLVRFDQKERTITIEAYHFLADPSNKNADNQFPGWPHTVSQFDNYDRQASGYLPTLQVSGIRNPVLMVTNEKTGELEYAVRIKGNRWTPKVFSTGHFTIKIGDPDKNKWKILTHLQPQSKKSDKTLEIEL
jgi:alkaline phosphatase D